MSIQQVTVETGQMQRYGPNALGAKIIKAAIPTIHNNTVKSDTAEIQNAYILTPEVKVPKAEEIKELIKDNGYPYKSAVYEAINRLVKQDLD